METSDNNNNMSADETNRPRRLIQISRSRSRPKCNNVFPNTTVTTSTNAEEESNNNLIIKSV